MSHKIYSYKAMKAREEEGLRLLAIWQREAQSLRRELRAAENHIDRLESHIRHIEQRRNK